MKNTTELRGDWNVIQGKLKQRFALQTGRYLLLVKGKQEEIYGMFQILLGKAKVEVAKLLSRKSD
jgi:uncharacterized protein YjbJ (UPF0337 family)